jgi:hypothetical protein
MDFRRIDAHVADPEDFQYLEQWPWVRGFKCPALGGESVQLAMDDRNRSSSMQGTLEALAPFTNKPTLGPRCLPPLACRGHLQFFLTEQWGSAQT